MSKDHKTEQRGLKFKVVEEKGDEVTIEIAPEDYARDRELGLSDEETLKPGRHTLRRGGFRKRHPEFKGADTTPRNVKVRISILLDLDVLNFFKERAAQPNAAPYQTQINNELRAVMERRSPYASLVADDQFIEAIAERVAEKRRRKRGRV